MSAPTAVLPAPQADQRRNRSLQMLLTAALLLIALAAITITSLAVFTDTENVTGNTFTTGTVDIAATPATAVVTMPAMAPGDQVTAPLTVDNLGTLALRYAITSTTTEDILAAELDLTIKTGVTTCTNAAWTADGTIEYTGILGTVATTNIIGDNTQGNDPGDRTLGPGGSEVLCVNVTLPLATTAGQGVTSTATLTFDAEQTINNP
jgi:predicted ribosomally synthesized peptide with SipW-like signal peptide